MCPNLLRFHKQLQTGALIKLIVLASQFAVCYRVMGTELVEARSAGRRIARYLLPQLNINYLIQTMDFGLNKLAE
jgi:hypothetical protein